MCDKLFGNVVSTAGFLCLLKLLEGDVFCHP